jgi:simple sugar transport system ATP-binding protein
VKKLSKQGKSVIFVSHKLEEVEMLCSQVDVFRAGKNVGQMRHLTILKN